MRASDPMFRFGVGGHRGAGGPASGLEQQQEAEILQVQEDHMERMLRAFTRMYEDLRRNRSRIWFEKMYAVSANRAEPQSNMTDQFRVTYIYAAIGQAGGTIGGTLFLQGVPVGSPSADTWSFTIPPANQGSGFLNITLGDELTGGIILARQDLRYVTTADGSMQKISAVLCGERLADQYLS